MIYIKLKQYIYFCEIDICSQTWKQYRSPLAVSVKCNLFNFMQSLKNVHKYQSNQMFTFIS